MIEFILVLPVALTVLFGLLAACWLFYQNSALHDGASGGARAASIETSLAYPTSGKYCESGQPVSIEQAVANAAPDLKINMGQLCAATQSATQLTQSSTVNGDVNITLTCGGTCAAPTTASVTLTLNTQGIASPLNLTYNMSATSEVPMLSP